MGYGLDGRGFDCWQKQEIFLLFTASRLAVGPTQPLIHDQVNCYWSSPAQSVLVSGPVGPHDHIFVLCKTFTCFEMGPPLRREAGSDYYWSLPLHWGWLERALTHSLTDPLPPPHTHAHTHTKTTAYPTGAGGKAAGVQS
jgi:hypothetical protein